LGQLQ